MPTRQLFEAIEMRHSYRGRYKNIPIEKDNLIKIVEAGLKAPSGKNQQTTEFIIVEDLKLVDSIATMHKNNKAMQQAKAFIVCIVDKYPEPILNNLSFQIEDCAAAVENMLLAITALGYASVWIDGWLRMENRDEIIREILGIPTNKKVQVILPVGVPEEICGQPKKKAFSERVWFNNYHKQS